jgi:hypothetical protein
MTIVLNKYEFAFQKIPFKIKLLNEKINNFIIISAFMLMLTWDLIHIKWLIIYKLYTFHNVT